MTSPVANILWALFGWIFLWPLTFFLPRNKYLFVVIGRDGGKFLDNSKHIYIGIQHYKYKKILITYLTNQPSVRKALLKTGHSVGTLTGFYSWWNLLRCGTAVVDSMDWSQEGRFTALRGARVVQLWHGIPLKRIERLVTEQIKAKMSLHGKIAFEAYRAFTGRQRRVDLLVSTSALVAREAMMRCFYADHWPVTGYPRNDVLLDERLRHHPLMELSIDRNARKVVQQAKIQGQPVALYAPTFRKHFIDPFLGGVIDLPRLDRFAQSHNAIILIKLHPWMRQPVFYDDIYDNVTFISPDSDIYPLLPQIDFLITDYSSIFFDFLLLDRPILFFCHDLEEYLTEDRGFIFDYEVMTPGPKVTRQTDLEIELATIFSGGDIWHEQRLRVRALVFDHVDGSAVERLMSQLQDDF